MALIECPECLKKISEFASFCPNCGCPMDKIIDLAKHNAKKNKFFESRNKSEQELILRFHKEIAKVYHPFFKANCKNIYYFGVGTFNNVRVLSWFGKNDFDNLILKYYFFKLDSKEIKVMIINNNNFDDALENVKDAFNSYLATQKNKEMYLTNNYYLNDSKDKKNRIGC